VNVGVNYPWFEHSWDFGQAPPGWRTTREPIWRAQIDLDLQRFMYLGITVVRWFILGDGLTYGSGMDAPRVDERHPDQWHFDPPRLSDQFQNDFELLLTRFAAVNANAERPIQLMPVLVDYLFCQPGRYVVPQPFSLEPETVPDPDWVKRGRVEAIADPVKCSHFLDRVLEPLLRVARSDPRLIYAWDIINEPEWVTTRWHPGVRTPLPVSDAQMRDFLSDAMARIRYAGFKATIGFNRLDTIRTTRILADYNQFHHYSPADAPVPLEAQPFNASTPGIVGEFATSSASDSWQELLGGSQRIRDRLRTAEARGYPLAIPWSYRQQDRHTQWVDEEIECYTQGRNCLPP
jgi:hypothetical protein